MEEGKIRVLEVFDSLEISGGVQSVVMNMVKEIDKSKFQIDFAVYDAPKERSYQTQAEEYGVKVHKISNFSEAGIVGFYKQFVKLLGENKYDAVHAHNLLHNGIILLAAKKCGIKNRISHSHQSFDDRNNKSPRNIISGIFKKLNLFAATKRVACSDLAAEFLYGKKKDYIFLPNALDLERFKVDESKIQLRHDFGINDDSKKALLHIGRFSAMKNQFFLIEIMKKLRDENCVLYMCGEGELKDEFFSKVKEEKLEEKIIYLGLRKDIPKLLKMSDVMLLPSLFEGLSVSCVEAQAVGTKAFISSNLSKQTDLGFGLIDFLPIDNADIWVDKINKIKCIEEHPTEEIHQKMQQLNFGINENLKVWERLYEK